MFASPRHACPALFAIALAATATAQSDSEVVFVPVHQLPSQPISARNTCWVDAPADAEVLCVSGPEHLALSATLSLNSTSASEVTVRLRSSNISAQAGADYRAINKEVSFAANTTDQRVDIGLINDLEVEERETFTIELSDKSDEQRLPLDYIHVTILDEDSVTMTVRNARSNESTREMLHYIALSDGVTWPIAFHARTLNGTATAPQDFAARDSRATHVPDPSKGKLIGVFRTHRIVDDAIDEPDETYTLRIRGLRGVRRAAHEGTMTIVDDDPTSTNILITAEPPRVSEGDGATVVRVTATLDASARTETTTVTVSVSGSGDAGAVDFAEVPDFTITIAEGETSGSGSFMLNPEDDNVDESNETITVDGSSDLSVTGDTVELVDDDQPSGGILLSVSPARMAEDGGERNMEVVATLDASARKVDTTVSVSVADSGRPDAVDYAASRIAFDITIAAGQTTGVNFFTVTPEDDDVDERDEVLDLTGTSDLPVTPTMATLTDDDPTSTEIVLSAVPSTVSEGAGQTSVDVTATLDAGARTQQTTVTVSVSGSGDSNVVDFAAVRDFTIMIAEGTTSGRASFSLTPEDDNEDESSETLTVDGSADLPVTSTTVTITDNDVASAGIVLSASPSLVSEDDGSVDVEVTASLTGAARETATTVAVSVTGSGNADAVDFEAVPDFTITIAASATSGTGTFDLVPVDDVTEEEDETLTVSGTSALPVTSTTVRLTDDDDPSTQILLSAAPSRVSEGDGPTPVTVTATLNRAQRQQPTPVNVSVSGSGDPEASDFEAVPNFTITIPANAASGTGAFTLTPEDDASVESDERLRISGVSDLPVAGATLTLADDDEVSTRILLFLAVDPPQASEGDGEIRVTVTAAVDRGVRPEETRIGVSVAGSGDPDAVDFEPVPDFDIVIPANTPSGTATITVVPEDDLVVENDETLTVSGVSDLPVTSATMVLLDDDEASGRITLSVDPARVSEGDGRVAMTVTASLDRGVRPEATTVAVSVSGSGNPDAVDFEAVPDFDITIEARELSGAGTFTLRPEDDTEDEVDETLTLTGVSDLPVAPASVVLVDDDEMPVRELSVADGAAPEGAGEVAFEVALDGPSAAEVTVSYATADPAGAAGSLAEGGVDYESASGTLRFAPGEVSKTIRVSVLDDDLDEADETFAIALSDAQGATLGRGTALGTIRDDDEPPVMSVADAAGNEDVGALAFGVTLSEPSGIEVSASYSTADGTATAGSDYAAAMGTLAFAPGEVSKTIRVAILDDNAHEADEEMFELSLSELVNATAGEVSATGTIRDDDLAPPTLAGELPEALLCVGGAPLELDLADYFGGDELRFSAVPSAPDVATAALEGSRLTVAPVSEGEGSVALTAANDSGSVESSMRVRVVTDPAELEAVDSALASIGRAVLTSVTGSVQARFAEPHMSTMSGGNAQSPDMRALVGTRWPDTPTPMRGNRSGGWDGRGLFEPQDPVGDWFESMNPGYRPGMAPFSFSLDSGQSASTGPGWSVWGRGDTRRFESGIGRSSHDGTLTAVHLGADARFDDWLAGVSVSRSAAEADYRFDRSVEACGGAGAGEGMIEADLTSAHPYAGRQVGDGWVWAALGAGSGEVAVERCETGQRRETDLSMRLGALGGRHPFSSGERVALSIVEEIGVLSLETGDAQGPIGDRSVTVGQARLGVEAAGVVPAGCECSLSSYVRALARGDWGDGATGAGLELVAGARFRSLPHRIGIDAEVRALAAHSAEDARERSANVTFSMLPRADGTGWRASLAWRQGTNAGVDMMSGIAPWTIPAARLPGARRDWFAESRLGYGIALHGGLATPFVELDAGHFEGVNAWFGVRHEYGDRARGLTVEWGIEPGNLSRQGSGVLLEALGRF